LSGVGYLNPQQSSVKPIKTQMSPVPLQFVLLAAIAISQIFGGVSCCCLWRSLTPSANISAQDFEASDCPNTPPTKKVACPKCAAKLRLQDTASTQTRTNKHREHAQVSDDGQCGCKKHVSVAKTECETTVMQFVALSMVGMYLTFVAKSTDRNLDRMFEVPLRLGGRSWQSISCVWKN